MEALEDLLRRAEELVDGGDYGAVVALLELVQEAGNPEVLYTLGLVCYRLEKYQEAINHLNQSLNLKPDYILALARRGLAYEALEQKELATADFEQALTIDPQDHHDWRGRGIAFGGLKQYEDEIASYDKAIEIKPDYHEAWYNRGNALDDLGRHEEAIVSYDKALEIKPDYHEAWYNRGIALEELGRHEEAIASYDKALEIKPDKHEAWFGQGIALEELGRYEEAIASYDRAIEIKPDYHLAWHNRGNALDDLGRYAEAIASFDQALEIKPDYHEAWLNRSFVLEKLGRYEEEIASCDRAIKIKPDFPEAWYNWGVALVNLGRYEEAITSYKKAIEFKPDYHEAWYNRGVALVNLGRYEEAITSYKKALEFKPDLYEAWNNLRSLATNQRLSFQDWLDLQQICEAGLKRITFEQEPERHLTIWKYYLWVCSRTRTPEDVKAIVEEASERFLRYLAQAQLQEIEAERFRKEFVRFDQIQVSTLAQMGELEQALEMAEKQRNFRLGWLINGQSYQQTTAPSYQQAQQLLKPDTAIIYWHYSLVGLTTFILKHGQSLEILLPPPAPPSGNSLGIQGDIAILKQVQDLEKWLEDWKNDYTAYGKNQAPDPDHSWRSRMKLRLDNPNQGSGSLKLILNIKQLIDKHLNGIDHLILIPHRDLHLLPLHSLFPFGYTTTYLPSLQIGLNLQTLPQPTTKPLLNLHQPTDSPYIELTKNILDILSGAETQNIPNLNKAQFLQLLQANHQALQFTGHGCHDPETPENSYLNLAEDKLLLTDILRHKQLDLSSYRLICLTACESGITTQSLLDEYIGWGSAFLARQARAVISTLWNVDVRSSAFLMIRFYQLFSKPENPLSAPQALREAQKWLSMLDYEGLADWYTELAKIKNLSPQYRDYLHTEAAKLRADNEKINSIERPFTNPYHWAGFICTGLLEQ